MACDDCPLKKSSKDEVGAGFLIGGDEGVRDDFHGAGGGDDAEVVVVVFDTVRGVVVSDGLADEEDCGRGAGAGVVDHPE